MNEVQVDALTFNGSGSMAGMGSVAQRLVSGGMNVNSLRPWIGTDGRSYINVNGKAIAVNANATLRKLEWEEYDKAIVKEARIRLNAIADLEGRGLVYNIANGLGKTVLETENLGEFTVAEISMDGLSKAQADRPAFGSGYLPLPIVHKDYFINTRVLASSRTTGDPLDVTSAELATRQVVEKMEDMLVNGAGAYAFGGGTIYGYTDFPSRNTGSMAYHWNVAGATGATIVADVLAMKAALIGDRMYGPYVLYVPTAYETVLDDDFKANSDLTIRQRILQIEGISAVKTLDKLTANNVLLVQMTSDVVRIVNGMAISPVEWQEQGGMVLHYKVMGIKVPQVRATQGGRCGIVHYT